MRVGKSANAVQGMGAPRGTPAEIVDKLNTEINAGLADPKLKARFADLGAAVFPDNALSPQQLIACADQAMYAAKAANKNCVRLAAAAAANVNPPGREAVPPGSPFQRIPDEKFIS